MSFLNPNYSAFVAARLTQKGRNAIAKGDFNISYFAVGDSEYNYNLSGVTQGVLAPLNNDIHVKYPIQYVQDGTTFGIPVQESTTVTFTNIMGSDTGWTLNSIWDKKTPIGVTGNTTGYTSNKYIGVKSFLGYSNSSGQTTNTGTTILNTMGELITISPEEQKSIAILHYSENGTELTGDTNFFKYDDYIYPDVSNFSVRLATLMYHRSGNSSTGTTFSMGTVDKTITSNKNSRFTLTYRDLVSTGNIAVGKVFYNHKLIVFDDEEIVATLDAGSSRSYTLTAPKVSTLVTSNYPITSLTTGKTMWVTYKFSGGTVSDDLPCNYFMKVTGSTNDEVVTVKFFSDDFKHLNNGYTATQFHILTQINSGEQPSPTLWKIGDFTSYLGSGATNLTGLTTGHTFTINQSNLPTSGYTSTLYSFGAERKLSGLTGSYVSMVRGTKVEIMNFKVNLPDHKFYTSQNPTYNDPSLPENERYGGSLKITEVALLNSNKETLVMGKLASPLTRSAADAQVISVKIDF
jgi:hypothetical protein